MHEALLEGNARAEEARLGVAVPNWRVALHGLTGAAGALSAAFTLATAAALWLGGSATEALWLLVPLTATHWLEAGVLLVYNAGGCSRCTRDGTQQVKIIPVDTWVLWTTALLVPAHEVARAVAAWRFLRAERAVAGAAVMRKPALVARMTESVYVGQFIAALDALLVSAPQLALQALLLARQDPAASVSALIIASLVVKAGLCLWALGGFVHGCFTNNTLFHTAARLNRYDPLVPGEAHLLTTAAADGGLVVGAVIHERYADSYLRQAVGAPAAVVSSLRSLLDASPATRLSAARALLGEARVSSYVMHRVIDMVGDVDEAVGAVCAVLVWQHDLVERAIRVYRDELRGSTSLGLALCTPRALMLRALERLLCVEETHAPPDKVAAARQYARAEVAAFLARELDLQHAEPGPAQTYAAAAGAAAAAAVAATHAAQPVADAPGILVLGALPDGIVPLGSTVVFHPPGFFDEAVDHVRASVYFVWRAPSRAAAVAFLHRQVAVQLRWVFAEVEVWPEPEPFFLHHRTLPEAAVAGVVGKDYLGECYNVAHSEGEPPGSLVPPGGARDLARAFAVANAVPLRMLDDAEWLRTHPPFTMAFYDTVSLGYSPLAASMDLHQLVDYATGGGGGAAVAAVPGGPRTRRRGPMAVGLENQYGREFGVTVVGGGQDDENNRLTVMCTDRFDRGRAPPRDGVYLDALQPAECAAAVLQVLNSVRVAAASQSRPDAGAVNALQKLGTQLLRAAGRGALVQVCDTARCYCPPAGVLLERTVWRDLFGGD